MKSKVTWNNLKSILPILNTSELERRCGFRNGRIKDVKMKRSSLSEEDLQTIENVLKKITAYDETQ